MRALLTGGTGFVGANLARRLLAGGHEVTLLTRPQAQRWRLQGIEDSVRLTPGDVSDEDAVQRAMTSATPDWVFHLAAHGAYSFETDPLAMVRTNVLGATHLLRAACSAGCAAMVLAGSSAEYGLCEQPPDEDHPPAPSNHYAATKAAATWMAQITAADPSSCPIVTLRLYSVYGPWEDPRRLLPTLLVQALRGRWPNLAARDTVRDFVHVDDVCEAMVAAARHAPLRCGAVYNVGSGVGTTLEQLVSVVRGALDVRAEPVFGSHTGHDWDTRMSWVSNPRRIESELGWRATTALVQGVGSFAAWLAEHRELYGEMAPVLATARQC
jgi:UDP-glucose 4-epimerase